MVMGNWILAMWLLLGYPIPEYMEPTRSYLPSTPTWESAQ